MNYLALTNRLSSTKPSPLSILLFVSFVSALSAMNLPRSRTQRPRETSRFYLSTLFILFSIAATPTNSLTFNISASMGCNQTTPGFVCLGDAFSNQGMIQLTRNQLQDSITNSVGWAVYSEPLLLWDSDTGKLTDFTTHFTFIINALNRSYYGDGLAFFLSPYPFIIPPSSQGGSLGLFNSSTNSNKTANRIVAVEFDSFQNDWDPSSDHIGIDINSIVSDTNVSWKSSIKDGRTANAWVTYSSSTHNLSVYLTYADNPVFNGSSSLSWTVDLRQVLPEKVVIGFSAATGAAIELHTILSWDFSSTLEEIKKSKIGWVIGVAFAAAALITGFAFLVWYLCIKKTGGRRGDEEGYDESIDDEFEQGRGPKRFPYRELVKATKNFTEDLKLGEGGFGSVYKGLLNDTKLEVAIKRVSRNSSQGKKEYISEVRTISRLRHRNLVQLVGWCHERADFLLVYEYMPNGSLDTHLYGKKALLAWPERYKIALGLASALLYLHEEWEQCVVHRDIKPSNVMLDSGFNAKLGDFGLARFVDHDQGSQTTILAGTMGYLAPECLTTGKASKESDVYSFGIVALEIACGRRPVEPKEEMGKVGLVEWVWGLYGRMMMIDAADVRLNLEFEEPQMERLMVVGLWCAHPDYKFRPTIRQAIAVLNFEATMPNLPSKMPVPTYFAPPMGIGMFSSYTSSSSQTSTGVDSNHTSGGYPTTESDNSTVSDESSSSRYLLRSSKK